MEVSGQLHAPAALTLGMLANWVRGWVGPRAELDPREKREISHSCWEWNLGSPARSLVTTLTELSRSLQRRYLQVNIGARTRGVTRIYPSLYSQRLTMTCRITVDCVSMVRLSQYVPFLAPISFFPTFHISKEMKVSLWDHLAVCVQLCIPLPATS
jgi:hypothetical protein